MKLRQDVWTTTREFGEVCDGPGKCTPSGWYDIIEFDEGVDPAYFVYPALKISIRLKTTRLK